MLESLNEAVANSAVSAVAASSGSGTRQLAPAPLTRSLLLQVGRYFQLNERKSTFSTELRAGVVTFLTVRRTEVAGAANKHVQARFQFVRLRTPLCGLEGVRMLPEPPPVALCANLAAEGRAMGARLDPATGCSRCCARRRIAN